MIDGGLAAQTAAAPGVRGVAAQPQEGSVRIGPRRTDCGNDLRFDQRFFGETVMP